MIKQLINRHPFWAYYVIAISIPTLLFTYLVGLEIYFQSINGMDYSYTKVFFTLKDELIESYPAIFHHKDSIFLYLTGYAIMPLALPFIFFPFAPTISALFATALGQGRAAVMALLSLYKPLQGSLSAREGLKIYGILIGFLATMVGIVCIREYYLGSPERAAAFMKHLGVIDWKIFLSAWLMTFLFNQGALLEELGWRGYALPLLTRRWNSPLIATILIGVAWALWHFPREIPFFISGELDVVKLLLGQIRFIITCVSMSIVASYFVNITGGSVIPALLIHGTLNMAGGMFDAGAVVGVRSEFALESLMMWVLAAVVVLFVAGRDLG